MPPVIFPILEGIESLFIVLGASGATALMLTETLVYAATGMLINAAIKALSPRPKSGASAGMEANYYNAEQRAPLWIGYVRAGGMETIPPITTGESGKFLSRILSLAIHEISSYETVMFDTTTVPLSAIGSISGNTNDGKISSGAFANKAWVRLYRGTATDSADWKLKNEVDAVAFTSAFRGQGIAKGVFMYQWDQDAYRAGIPTHQLYAYGARMYDPRQDSTNGGSGSQRYGTVSTWQYSNNPAIALAWYLQNFGLYDPATEIDWASVAAAANVCDALVNIPGSTTQKRYTCNGMMYVHTSQDEFTMNVQLLVDAMLGRIVYANGIWSMQAGAWTTPTFALTEADWINPPEIQFENGIEKRFNRAHMWYIDPNRNWQRAEAYIRDNATYRTADGERLLNKEFDQPFCTNEYEAQRKSEMMLRSSRNQIIVTGRLGPKWQNLSVWDTGTIDMAMFGWSSKTFRCAGYTLNPDASVTAVFAEEQSTDWTDLTSGEYNTESVAPLPTVNDPKPTAPQSLTLSETIAGTILATVGRAEVQPLGTEYAVYASPFSDGIAHTGSAYQIADGAEVTKFIPWYPGIPYYYWAQAHVGTYASGFYPASYGSPFMLNPKADNTYNNRYVPDADFTVGTPAYWTMAVPAASSIAYLSSGGTIGGRVLFAAASYGFVRQTNFLGAYPHPNNVCSGGLPLNNVYSVFRTTVRFRVNSAAGAPQLYAWLYAAAANSKDINCGLDGIALSGGQTFPLVAAANSWQEAVYYHVWNGIDAVNVGSDYNYSSSLSLPLAAQPALQISINAGGMANFEIDKYEVENLGGLNSPLVKATPVGGFQPSKKFIQRLNIAASDIAIGSAEPYWPIGWDMFISKPSSYAARNIYALSSSVFLLTNSQSLLTSGVHTYQLPAAGLFEGRISRVDSYLYMVRI